MRTNTSMEPARAVGACDVLTRSIARPGPGEIVGETGGWGSAALFSRDYSHRYLLLRRTDSREAPAAHATTIAWVMLNPSTADARTNDATMRRVVHFSHRWGYAEVLVANLYSLRSPHPRDIARAGAGASNSANDYYMHVAMRRAEAVVFAWGAHPSARVRAPFARALAAARGLVPHCLGVTASGAPIHPMARGRRRVPDDAQPALWFGGPLVLGAEAGR